MTGVNIPAEAGGHHWELRLDVGVSAANYRIQAFIESKTDHGSFC